MWSLVFHVYQDGDWPILGVLALQQVLIHAKWATTTGLSPEAGPSGRVEPHHIASNECLWEGERQHHVEGLGGPDSRYQTDSVFEED